MNNEEDKPLSKYQRRQLARAKVENIPSRFMDTWQYGRHVDRSERTVKEWVYNGTIPAIQIGKGKIMIDPVKADRALERFEKKAVSAE